MGALPEPSREFIAGMIFNVKSTMYVYESQDGDTALGLYTIDQIFNAVAQIKKPSWPITRLVHVVGPDHIGLFPVAEDEHGEYFIFKLKGNESPIYARDLIPPQGAEE